MRVVFWGIWMGIGIIYLYKGNPAAMMGCIVMAELQIIQKNQEK